MGEIDRFEKVIQLVERYEDYLFQKAMGIALIICGIIFPLSALMVLYGEAIAYQLHVSPTLLTTLLPSFLLLIGISVIVYKFSSAHVVKSRIRKESIRKDIPHIFLMFLIWFTAFYITNFVPESYSIISWLWAGGGASLLSYLIMRRAPYYLRYTELLLIGGICLFLSLPLLRIQDEQLVLIVTVLTFSASFIVGGLYSTVNAMKVLSQGET